MRAGIDAASARRALARALDDATVGARLHARPVHVIAAGKAAAHMARAWLDHSIGATRRMMAVGTYRDVDLPTSVEWHEAGHPLPDRRSIDAATRALDIAREVARDEVLLILLSGGASALLALPLPGISLSDKQRVIDLMLRGGADIHALNTVRKHLSGVKGGRLAAACAGITLTLAISDVVGDDLAVIGSGPGVPDPTTWSDAARAVNRWVNPADLPASITAVVAKGLAGAIAETPKAGNESLARAEARVIASATDAVEGARLVAEQRGYRALVLPERVVGEARVAAGDWLRRVRELREDDREVCVISAGETTVRVRGAGRGGRNQEFALAIADALAAIDGAAVVGSLGTDGIDGPTDAAGAIADGTTIARASKLGLSAADYLQDNNSYRFFQALDDLIVTGPTGTNVGDLQVFLRRV